MSSRKTVGYILKRFPVLTETFVLNEILALEAKGVPIHIFALERPNDSRFHEVLSRLKAHIWYIPDVFEIRKLMLTRSQAVSTFAEGHQRARNYVLKHGRPGLFWRYLQSCYVAIRSRKFGIDHFHAHFATRPTTVAFLASMITQVPYSFTAHALDIYKTDVSPKVLAKKIRNARFVVTISETNRNLLVDLSPESSQKIVKIYNGIPLEFFHLNGIPERDPFVFLCVARFVEKKGHAVLLNACKELQDRGIKFQCRLAGRGPLEGEIENRIRRLGLEECVKILGPLTQMEVAEAYRNSHAFVLPCITGADGNRDGLPVSIVQALACGRPVISTPITGIPEVIRDQQNGLLVPAGDATALAEAMRQFILDPAFYERLCSNTRKSVESEFNLNETILKLQALIEKDPY